LYVAVFAGFSTVFTGFFHCPGKNTFCHGKNPTLAEERCELPQRVRVWAEPDRQTIYRPVLHFKLRIMPLVPQNQQSNTYFDTIWILKWHYMQINKRSMKITNNLVTPWLSYHYRTPLGQILGCWESEHRDTPGSSPMKWGYLGWLCRRVSELQWLQL